MFMTVYPRKTTRKDGQFTLACQDRKTISDSHRKSSMAYARKPKEKATARKSTGGKPPRRRPLALSSGRGSRWRLYSFFREPSVPSNSEVEYKVLVKLKKHCQDGNIPAFKQELEKVILKSHRNNQNITKNR